jgi:predicted nucleotidyltransferase
VSDFDALVTQFDAPGVRAIVLFGSFARGDPDAFSDVDLVHFLAADAPELPGEGAHLIDGRLVVVSSVRPDGVEAAFTRPEVAVDTIAGLRAGKALLDRDETFARIQARARDFVWDGTMQAKADAWASRQMVGWIEEVYKGLGGLRAGPPALPARNWRNRYSEDHLVLRGLEHLGMESHHTASPRP